MSRQDWRTPPSVFAKLNADFGPFDLDAAASDDWHLCERYYTEADTGLRAWPLPPPGQQHRAFINPPFESAGKWIDTTSGNVLLRRWRGVMVLHAAIGTGWFHDAWHLCHLLLPSRRIAYWHPDTDKPQTSPDRESMILLFGYEDDGYPPHKASPWECPPHADECRRLWHEANGQMTLGVG